MSALLVLWRHLPNVLSSARIGATPVLGYFAASGAEQRFTWLLVPALLTDIADGYLARRYGLSSELGALLDSVADALLFFVAIYGVWALHPELLRAHAVAGLMVAGAWVVVIAAALVRYGRLSSFHTYASKAAGYLLGILVAVLFVWGLPAPLLYLAVAASVGASLEELALIALLPEWRSNVRGLYWVVRERRGPGP
jgi:CDP-diacylglycerol--glycerol-3-phosphate 3-phosphatidyltransferase